MAYFVGAYAASPNTTGWDPELEARYYARLRALPGIKGLEHPFLGSLHPHDDAWFVRHIDPNWRFVFTCIPGVMAAMANNPQVGLASDDAAGREAALAFVRQARDAIAALNAACGRPVVDALEIHSAPDQSRAASSVAALTASLATLVQWEWHGARLVIEHCDAHVPGQVASKGFLSLADEIAAIETTNARYGSQLGIVVNWGRSVLEARSAVGALQHIQLAKQHGLLAGLMFSGASGQDTPYGAWRDSHMPPAPSVAGGIGAEGSLLTEAALQACLRASDGRQLPIRGLSIGIRPLEASLDERMAYLSHALSRLDTALVASKGPP
ncbi:MAG: hypothetical protein RIS90_470 [Pseudomonadota bacterium]